jgi:polyferredoxin
LLFGKKSNHQFLALIKIGVTAFIGVLGLTGAVVALIWGWVCMENILGFLESWDQTIA